MSRYFCLSFTLLDGQFHGRRDGGVPEWPPSPLRAFQALVAAADARWKNSQLGDTRAPALEWLEGLGAPEILAPVGHTADHSYRLYVPNNAGDLVFKAWANGNMDASIASHRTEKDVRPTRFGKGAGSAGGETVRFLWELTSPPSAQEDAFVATLSATARSVTHLGWGVDMAAGRAGLVEQQEILAFFNHAQLERWKPAAHGTPLRIPRPEAPDGDSTFRALIRRHEAFTRRMTNGKPTDVPPLSAYAYEVVAYRRPSDPIELPRLVYQMLHLDGSRFSYPQAKLIHIAGMVRHQAIEAMKISQPEKVVEDWVETYVAGHRRPGAANHRQLSYLPLPSIGHAHTDPSVRRVMIVAPVGDERVLRHLGKLLDGRQLKPTPQTSLNRAPLLVRTEDDKVARCYTRAATEWASVTPVILPGHDDHKSEKTRKLIATALEQSGVELPCDFEWHAFSQFPKSLSAYKYGRDKRTTGYIRPDHLLSQTAVHLKLRFHGDLKMPGPLVIGAGRHYGFGLMAGIDQ